jgi:hypothetical protein
MFPVVRLATEDAPYKGIWQRLDAAIGPHIVYLAPFYTPVRDDVLILE